jgi:hypothetical protein
MFFELNQRSFAQINTQSNGPLLTVLERKERGFQADLHFSEIIENQFLLSGYSNVWFRLSPLFPSSRYKVSRACRHFRGLDFSLSPGNHLLIQREFCL